MTLTMLTAVGDKGSVDLPPATYVVQAAGSETTSGQQAPSGGGRVQKKHLLIAVSVVAIVGLVIAGIMIGMYMFGETQKEIIKFSLQFKASDNEPAKQDVVSDPNDNVVMYHVSKPGQDINVVQDFNKDIQVVKIETPRDTNCYISALNRTQTTDPSHITGASSLTGSDGPNQTPYIISGTPVKDSSFLTKKARDMCQGVSVYWAYRSCGAQNVDGLNITRTADDRNKRSIYIMNPVYGMYGLGGCCAAYFACELQMVETIQGNYHLCETYFRTGTCCGPVTPAPYCHNVYRVPWNTPGLNCLAR